MINFRKRKETEEVLPLPQVMETATEENVENSIAEEPMDEEEVTEPEVEEESEAMKRFYTAAEAYAKGKGVENELFQEALGIIECLRKLGKDDTPTLDQLEILLRGLDFERAIAEAKKSGELEGRNKQIEDVYMSPEESDGMPHLGSTGSARKSSRGINSIFDLAKKAK